VMEKDSIPLSCGGCKKLIPPDSVENTVNFADDWFHPDCFTCSVCTTIIDCENQVVLLSEEGKAICLNCSYRCKACDKPILEEAVSTGEYTYHTNCFKCDMCMKQIDNLTFAIIEDRLLCIDCHSLNATDIKSLSPKDEYIQKLESELSKSILKNEVVEASYEKLLAATKTSQEKFLQLKIEHHKEILKNKQNEQIILLLQSEILKLKNSEEEEQKMTLKRREETSGSVENEIKEFDDVQKKLSDLKVQCLEMENTKLNYDIQIQNFEKEKIVNAGLKKLEELEIKKLTESKALLIQEIQEYSSKLDTGKKINSELAKPAKLTKYDSSSSIHSVTTSTLPNSTSLQQLCEEVEVKKPLQKESSLLNIIEKEEKTKKNSLWSNNNGNNSSAAGKKAGKIKIVTSKKLSVDKGNSGIKESLNYLNISALTSPIKSKNKSELNLNLLSLPADKKHTLFAHSYVKPQKCDFCHEKLWGKEQRCQGSIPDCSYHCHTKCAGSIPLSCTGNPNDLTQVFGVALQKVLQMEGTQVPNIVKKCMDFEGIYRKSGPLTQINKLIQQVNKGEELNFGECIYPEEVQIDIMAITSILKQYFRDLPNPLINFEVYAEFMDASRANVEDPSKHDLFKKCLIRLPKENFNTLKYLLNHLSRVEKYSSKNLMSFGNLGVVFGPTLLKPLGPTTPLDDIASSGTKSFCIEYLIRHYDLLFNNDDTSNVIIEKADGRIGV
ncbi:hypothetical protein HK099_005655, partial [Clydaea vesicula]